MGILGAFPPQDNFYGIDQRNIALRLTRHNWATKAVVRICDGQWLYLWIRQLNLGDEISFYVRCHALHSVGDFEAEFPDIEKALGYINGEDGGLLAQKSRAAKRVEWPPNQPPKSWIGTMK